MGYMRALACPRIFIAVLYSYYIMFHEERGSFCAMLYGWILCIFLSQAISAEKNPWKISEKFLKRERIFFLPLELYK